MLRDRSRKLEENNATWASIVREDHRGFLYCQRFSTLAGQPHYNWPVAGRGEGNGRTGQLASDGLKLCGVIDLEAPAAGGGRAAFRHARIRQQTRRRSAARPWQNNKNAPGMGGYAALRSIQRLGRAKAKRGAGGICKEQVRDTRNACLSLATRAEIDPAASGGRTEFGAR